jgi:DNA-binding response OmpR family regulator
VKVLLIEDDIQLNTTISNFLQSISYKVVSVLDGEVAINTIDKEDFNLFIIDINIPTINGLEIVKYIRQKDLNTPIVIITASIELNNFKSAFEYGCSEYIKKPFFLEELEIRINNLLCKRIENIINISQNISYDVEYEELKIDNEVIKLRKKERRLLTILLQNLNHTVDNETLCSYIWENEIKQSYPLRQLVSELRKYFDTSENFIFSDVGIGYRFEAKN